jgi:hypothetical protein
MMSWMHSNRFLFLIKIGINEHWLIIECPPHLYFRTSATENREKIGQSDSRNDSNRVVILQVTRVIELVIIYNIVGVFIKSP